MPLGGDLRQVSPALHRSVSASGGTKFPCHFHPQGNGSGGEVRLTHTHTHIFLLIPTLINICSIELRMLSMFMEHEASSVNSTHHCLQRVEGYSPVMSAAAVLIIFSLAPSRSTGCLAISNLRTSKGGSWWLLICLAEGWTSSGSTSSSTTTCQKILTPIYTGWVLKSGKTSVDVLFHEGIWGVEARL